MTITLDLSSDLERKLASEARQRGLTLQQYALNLLAQQNDAVDAHEPIRTGAELVAYWEREGLIGVRTDITDPSAYARELRKQAETRVRD